MFPDTVVVPLDGSDFANRAVPIASAFAQQSGMGLVLVTTRWDGEAAVPRACLERIASTLTCAAVDTAVILDREAADAIELVSDKEPGRVVCMTTHGRGRLRWALLGSVAEQVVANAANPMILVGRECRPEESASFRRMLVCVDGSSDLPAVLPATIDWVKALDLEIHVATAFHPLDGTSPDELLDRVSRHYETEGLRVREHFVRSSYPAGALADLAVELGADILAMSSHARTGAARFALGSITMGVVGMASCPVLVARTP